MQLSHRITNLNEGGSDGWDLFNRARKMIAAGVPVIELTMGEHDIRTAPAILQEMHRSAMSGHTGYASVPGTPALRDAIAARITERTGVKTNRDNITVTSGGQAALFAAHTATCNQGDTALFIDPYYATYPGTIRGVGAVPKSVSAFADKGFQPQAEDIRAASRAASRTTSPAASLLINSPNNPTGVIYTDETLRGIAQVCRDQDMWLISDEVYDTQIWNGHHLSPRALPDMAERTLVIGSMSKSHAMTGSRIGWIAGPPEAIEHLINLATNTTYGVPGYIQDAALFALNQGPALETEVAAPFARRRKIAQDLLAGSNALRHVPCDGAMYIMLDIRATGMSGEDFAEALLDAEQIAVMPGESFGACAAGHLRIAMTVDDDTFKEALTRLIRFAEARIDARTSV